MQNLNEKLSIISLIDEKLKKLGLGINKKQLIVVIVLVILTLFGLLLINWNSQPQAVIKITSGKNASSSLNSSDKTINNLSNKHITNNDKDSQSSVKKVKKQIFVHVAGAVIKPGVYSLDEGSRIVDALNVAGGGSADSDLNVLNLAEKIADGQKIYVPTKEEVKSLAQATGQGTQVGLANFNQSSSVGSASNKGSNTNFSNLNSIFGLSSNDESNDNVAKIDLNSATLEQLDSLPGVGQVTAQRIIDYRENNGMFKSVEELKEVEGIGEKKFEKLKDHVVAR